MKKHKITITIFGRGTHPLTATIAMHTDREVLRLTEILEIRGVNPRGRDASSYENYKQTRNPPWEQEASKNLYAARESYYMTTPTPPIPYPFLPPYLIMPQFPYQYPYPQYSSATRPVIQPFKLAFRSPHGRNRERKQKHQTKFL